MNLLATVSWILYSVLHWIALRDGKPSELRVARCTIGWAWVSALFWVVLFGWVKDNEHVYLVLAMIFFVLLSWPSSERGEKDG